ncbi:hypothetical protein [Cytobacillus horneckiae]|uniref:Uncharacterized protein n=1 Tax=Cytobacillus horneckiae TaxID=549687 RepID=A0A2N0ZB02_9BACI|nr:hypothetical protein [Cytobacillus horneckiae]MEC1158691.1 hypothetical protein [Cytobacillus horneckiae]NRG46649.1 hypothetical protein [Bacillus sp. CRN 9]PKG26697.1 hypothetical protein CWS20_22890 [Cytobacillus horneckiae]
MNWNEKVQFYLSAILTLTAITLLVTTFNGLFVPSPFMGFILTILSLGLYTVHVLQKQTNKFKEVLLVALSLLFPVLIISSLIYKVWVWEAFFTKHGITQLTLSSFIVLAAYLCMAYVRAKVSYKRVKGNQKHNTKWRLNKKKVKEIEDSEQIYLKLGTVYENPDK